MIKRLTTGVVRRPHSTLYQVFYQSKTTGTWIAVSPDEIIPERYINLIDDDELLRKMYDVPEEWKLIKLSEENNNFGLVDGAINEITSVSTKKTIKESWEEVDNEPRI